MTPAEAIQKYQELAHAMQAGVALEMQWTQQTEPKHLRVGVNSAMVDHAALAGLLIKKGIITDEEYVVAIAEQMEREVESYTARIKEHYGNPNMELSLH